jgi:hypothetical protein
LYVFKSLTAHDTGGGMAVNAETLEKSGRVTVRILKIASLFLTDVQTECQ